MIAGVLDTRAICRLAFIVVGAIAIMIAVDVLMLLLPIVIRVAPGVA